MADSKPGWVPAGVKSMPPFKITVDFNCELKLSGFELITANLLLLNAHEFAANAFECAEVIAGEDNCCRAAPWSNANADRLTKVRAQAVSAMPKRVTQ